jgi:hypothetical protein
VDKFALGQVSSEYFVSLANSRPTKCSILIVRGRYSKPIGGRRSKGAQPELILPN